MTYSSGLKNFWVFRTSWGFKRVMLNEVKHPRGVGILRFAQNDKTPRNPEEPNFSKQSLSKNGTQVNTDFTAFICVHL